MLLPSKSSTKLREWIDQARHSEFGSLVRFAYGLQKDISVAAAVTTSWSSGQVEGHINRLKTIKRQMYGRGGVRTAPRPRLALLTSGYRRTGAMSCIKIAEEPIFTGSSAILMQPA